MREQTRVSRCDSIPLDTTYFTEEGYLVDHPIVTSVGIFVYHNPDGSERRELRLPEEVFAEKSLQSYKGKPIIVTHDAGYVSTENVQEEGVGTILSPGYRDGDDVRAEIIIHDTQALKQTGLRELSCGYNLRLEETPGVWQGQPYDAIQRDIEINHLALVDKARAGEQARLNIDSRSDTSEQANSQNNILSGGRLVMKKTDRKDQLTVTPEEENPAVEAFKQRRAERLGAKDSEPETLAEPEAMPNEQPEEQPVTDRRDAVQCVQDRRDRRDAAGDPEDLSQAMAVIAEQDEDIDALLGVIDVLKAEAVAGDNGYEQNADEAEAGEKPETADRKDRADGMHDFRELLRVVRVGDRLRMDGLETMSVKDAKKAVLRKLKPELRMDGKSASYVSAAFDMAVAEMGRRKDTNDQRRQMMRQDGRPEKATGSAADARQRMIERQLKNDQ